MYYLHTIPDHLIFLQRNIFRYKHILLTRPEPLVVECISFNGGSPHTLPHRRLFCITDYTGTGVPTFYKKSRPARVKLHDFL